MATQHLTGLAEPEQPAPEQPAPAAPAASGSVQPPHLAAAEVAPRSGYRVASGYRVNVRQGPTTDSKVVRVLPLDATIEIRCQTYGQTVTGPYGASDIWDCIGTEEYVSDAYVDTGSDGFVSSRCDT